MSGIPDNTRFALHGSPTEWADYADELKAAAGVLWVQHAESVALSHDAFGRFSHRPTISRSFVLLAGFALENVLKGIIVARDPSQVSGGRLSRTLTSHRIGRLAELARESLDEDEARFCALAEEAIPYWARYPIPLSADRLKDEMPVSATHQQAFERLFARARMQLHDLMKTGWDSGEGVRLASHFDSRFDKEPPAG